MQAADKKSDNAQRDRLKNQFNLGVADCPVFPNIFDYCQVCVCVGGGDAPLGRGCGEKGLAVGWVLEITAFACPLGGLPSVPPLSTARVRQKLQCLVHKCPALVDCTLRACPTRGDAGSTSFHLLETVCCHTGLLLCVVR